MISISVGFQDWVLEIFKLKWLEVSSFKLIVGDTQIEEKSTFSKITDEQRAKIIETIVRDFDIDGLSFEHIETDRKWFLTLKFMKKSLKSLQ